MNKRGRKDITLLIERVAGMRAALDELRQNIETIRDEEEDDLDAMPESLQSGTKGAATEKVISQLGAAVEAVDKVEAAFGEMASSLECAAT